MANNTPRRDQNAKTPMFNSGEGIVLGQIAERLRIIETKLANTPDDHAVRPSPIWDVLKAFLTGWPALGFVVLLLFYGPLREALQAIPEKVRTADQIDVAGVSLKSTLRVEAARSGIESLAETVPALSPDAIEILLRSHAVGGLTSYSGSQDAAVTTFWFLDAQMLSALSELEAKGLVVVATHVRGIRREGVDVVRASADDLKKKYPGRTVESSEAGRVGWELETSLAVVPPDLPNSQLELTELGRSAAEVIIRSVSSALAPAPQTPATK